MTTPNPTGLAGQRVLLRALRRDDLETLRTFVNDPEVMKYSNTFRPVHDVQQEQWFELMAADSAAVWFGLVDLRRDTKPLVGTCCLVDIDWVGRSAELRIRLGVPGTWGQGLGTEASRLLVGFGFGELNLERIWLRVIASNERAIRLYQGLGFKLEGKLRRAAYARGKSVDMLLMGLLRDEWPAGG